MSSFIFYFQNFNPVRNHLMAELGVMIEECLQGMGMRNAHFSMVFWSKVIHPVDIAVLSSLEDSFFLLTPKFFFP
jgi:hypothetical protein